MALLQIAEPGMSAEPHQQRLAAGIDLGTTNSLVATVRNENYRLILEKRYLCFMTWEQISLDMHYTNRWLRKMHERALDVVDRILQERSGCP